MEKVRVILDCDLVTPYNSSGYAIVRYKGDYGVINTYGKMIIDFDKHQTIEPTNEGNVFVVGYYGSPGFKKEL